MQGTTVAAIVLCSTPETYVRRAALAALASLCRPVVVIAEDSARKEVAGLPVDVVVSTAIGAGLEAALISTPHLDAAVFLRADQPYVTAGSIRHLLDAFQQTHLPIAAAAYEHRVDLPALFARQMFAELRALPQGANPKGIIEQFADRVASVTMPEAAAEIESFAEMEALKR